MWEKVIEQKRQLLEDLLSKEETIDKYILDEKNAIIVIENNDEKLIDTKYKMIHVRLIKGNLVVLNEWHLKDYNLRKARNGEVLNGTNLFKIQCEEKFNGLYDFKSCRFVIEPKDFDTLYYGISNKFLKKYNGILGQFKIKSDYEQGDTFSYINIVTNEEITETFKAEEGNYYAIINIDGTIRKNKLFKGSEFSKIEEVIDLNDYESLEEFKTFRKIRCNELKELQKKRYYEIIKEKRSGDISPYLDKEVYEVINSK